MPFDLDNDRTPAPPKGEPIDTAAPAPAEESPPKPPIQMVKVSDYMQILVDQGKIDQKEQQRRREGGVIGHHSVVDARTWALPGNAATSPRSPVASWKLDTHGSAPKAPRRVVCCCPSRFAISGHAIASIGKTASPTAKRTAQQQMAFGDLLPGCTVGDLRELVRSVLLPGPYTQIILESWGRPLEDAEKTLREYQVNDDAKVMVLLVERNGGASPGDDRGLRRLRVRCSCLQLRSIEVDAKCKGADLKSIVEKCLGRGQYEWWDADGNRIKSNNATTLLALEAKAAEEGGTDAVELGEELIIDSSQALSLRGGKGSATARRMISGTTCTVTEAMVAFLDLKCDKMTLSYGGNVIQDTDSLWSLGCRTDDLIDLEFESPCVPPILTLLRSEDAPKAAKGGGGKGKKKK